MQIIVVSDEFPSGAFKFIKMFYFQLPKINLIISSEIIVFGIKSYILIEIVYDIFVNKVKVYYLKVYIVAK